jgi:ABC-type nitrate/sulfonate/bicarbonate transport system permease component
MTTRWLRRIGRPAAELVLSIGLLIGAWYLFLWAFGVGDFVGKKPHDVWRYLFDVPEAAANREELRTGLGQTLYDATAGFIVGTAISVGVAIAFVLWRSVEQALMPFAMAIRTVPIIAMVPLIGLIWGRELVGTVVAVSIVVFFPTLVFVMFGLRSVPPEALELLVVYDAGRWTRLRKALLPAAVPSLFTAARVGAPSAILGALLCEWLLTGRGLGRLMVDSTTLSKFNRLWAAAVLVMIVAMIVFTIVTAIERAVNERFRDGA